MAFGFNPAGNGFPSQAPEGFPNFIQFQADGTDLGDADADTVNFRRGLSATRGTGESSGVVTVDAAGVTWREISETYTLEAADLTNGLRAVSDASSLAVIVPDDDVLGITDADDGVSLLVFQQGIAQVSVIGDSGVTVNVRSALEPRTAGYYSVISLIHTGTNEWVVCGDLEAAT